MARQERCTAPTQSGEPCKSFAISERGFCVSHDPEYQARKHEGSRRGGEAKANARRAAKQWAAIGREIDQADLPAVLRAAIAAVWEGPLEPSQASAIATLAKTSVAITNEIELEARIAALEAAAGIDQTPGTMRRIA
jgi:hypothetical protein